MNDYKYIIGISCMILLGSCSSTANFSNDHIHKSSNADDIDIVSLNSMSLQNRLNVYAVVYNTDGDDRQIYYRCIFYDNHSLPIDNTITWQPLLIYGESRQHISCIANSTSAVDFQLEISATQQSIDLYH